MKPNQVFCVNCAYLSKINDSNYCMMNPPTVVVVEIGGAIVLRTVRPEIGEPETEFCRQGTKWDRVLIPAPAPTPTELPPIPEKPKEPKISQQETLEIISRGDAKKVSRVEKK